MEALPPLHALPGRSHLLRAAICTYDRIPLPAIRLIVARVAGVRRCCKQLQRVAREGFGFLCEITIEPLANYKKSCKATVVNLHRLS